MVLDRAPLPRRVVGAADLDAFGERIGGKMKGGQSARASRMKALSGCAL